jgi:hypothetical protein
MMIFDEATDKTCINCNHDNACISVQIYKDMGLGYNLNFCKICAEALADGLREEESNG